MLRPMAENKLWSGAFAGAGSLTAAGTGDATAVTSPAGIDRLGFGSGTLLIVGKTTVQESKTLSLTIELQSCATASGTYTAFETVTKTAYVTGGTGGNTQGFIVMHDFDLQDEARYIKAKITPDLSATGTDTALWGAAIVLAGPEVTEKIPITKANDTEVIT